MAASNENRANENREMFERILREMSEGILILGLDGKIVIGNEAARGLLGLSGPIEGRTLAQVFIENGGELYDQILDTIMDAVYHGSPQNVALDYVLKSERKRYFLSTFSVKDRSRRVGIAAVIRDITDLGVGPDGASPAPGGPPGPDAPEDGSASRSENSMALFETVIREMEEGILVLGLDGRILIGNAAVIRDLGLRAPIEDKTLAQVFLESDGDRYDGFVDTIMDTIYRGVPQNSALDYCLDGKDRKYFVSTFSVKDAERRIGVVAVIRDITEIAELRSAVDLMEGDRLEALQDLAAADSAMALFESVIRDMSEGILVVGLDGRIVIGNEAVRDQLGLQDAIDGKTLLKVFLESSGGLYDGFIDTIMAAIYDGEPQNVTLDYELDGVPKKYFVSTFFVHENEKRTAVVAVIHDVTEIMELRDAVSAMEEIRRLNSSLQKRNDFIRKIFGRYLSDEVVESILTSEQGDQIGGTKRTVTIMFADLRGSTEIAERLDAASFLRMLNRFLEEMIEVISAYRGTILEFEGDSIVAVFGAPRERPGAARDAVVCAVRMQERMAAVDQWERENGLPDLRMGIGIHTGSAILGNIGSRTRMKYDAIGRNVNLASRIQELTSGGQILISDDTLRAAGPGIVLREGGSRLVRPKGIRRDVLIHEAIGVTGDGTDDRAGAVGAAGDRTDPGGGPGTA